MKQEKIEKAANEKFSDNSFAYNGFIAGAEWRINGVWHEVSETPDFKKLLLVEDIDGSYYLTYLTKIKKRKGLVQYCHYTSWAYVEDLLPNIKKKTNEEDNV